MDAIPVERGCGTREEGGLYWELGMGPTGRPLLDFLMDPPQPLPDGFKVPARGVVPLVRADDQGGYVVHLIDRIGLEHYPNLADFVEEMARFGASRRLPKSLLNQTVDVPGLGAQPVIELLTPASRLLLVHDRAIIENWQSVTPTWGCPKGLERHDPASGYYDPAYLKLWPQREHCLGRCWFDVEGGERTSEFVGSTFPIVSYLGDQSFIEADNPRLVRRRMPSFSYLAVERPGEDDPAEVHLMALDVAAGQVEPYPGKHPRPIYTPAIFASLPCSRLAVVSGPGAEETLAKATRAKLRVEEAPL